MNAIDGHQHDASPLRKRTQRRNALSRCLPGAIKCCKKYFDSSLKATLNRHLVSIRMGSDPKEDATLPYETLTTGLARHGLWRETYVPALIAWIIKSS